MLVLSRKASESIQIGDGIIVKIIEIQKNRVKIGISAPNEVPIHRSELLEIEPDEVELAGDSFRDTTTAHDISSNHAVMHQVVL